jgi:hypothetical protein
MASEDSGLQLGGGLAHGVEEGVEYLGTHATAESATRRVPSLRPGRRDNTPVRRMVRTPLWPLLCLRSRGP